MIIVSIVVVFLLGFPLAMIGGSKQGKVSLNERVTLPFTVKENTKVILLYFGYVGCKTICEPSLGEISAVYNELSYEDKINVTFYFINVAKNGTIAKEFASYFNGDFIGLDLSKKDTSQLMADLRAYSSDSLSGDGEISHTGYLYLITQTQPDSFELKTIYFTRPFDKESIARNIKQELQ